MRQQRFSDRRKKPSRRGNTPQKPAFIPKPGHNELRVAVLGGVSEIGKNMYALEYNDTIVILECGTMFGESTTPGIDSVMPNIQYLKSRKHAIKGMVVTDASLQHTGAIANVVRELGPIPIYTRQLTQAVIENRLRQARRTPSLTFHAIEDDTSVEISDGMTFHFFGASSWSPTTLGLVIETATGSVAYTGSLRPEHKDGVIRADEEKRFARLRDTDILLGLADSVNAERPGFSLTDEAIADDVVTMIAESPGRVLTPLVHSQGEEKLPHHRRHTSQQAHHLR